MGNNYKSINTKVIVDPSGVKPALTKVQGDLKSFADKASGLLGVGGIGFLGSGVSSLSTSLTSVLASATSLGGAFGIAGASVAGILGSLKAVDSFVDNQGEKILALQKSADKIGVGRQERAGFDVMFGKEGGEEFAGSLVKMNKLIGEAAGGSDEAQKKLSQFGLSVQDLDGKTKVQQIEAFSKAIFDTGNSAEKTKLAIDLLGKSGAEQLLKLNAIGKGGLGEATAFAMEVGLPGTDAQLLDALEEQTRDRRNAARWAGTKNRIATNIGPAAGLWDWGSDKFMNSYLPAAAGGAGIIADDFQKNKFSLADDLSVIFGWSSGRDTSINTSGGGESKDRTEARLLMDKLKEFNKQNELLEATKEAEKKAAQEIDGMKRMTDAFRKLGESPIEGISEQFKQGQDALRQMQFGPTPNPLSEREFARSSLALLEKGERAYGLSSRGASGVAPAEVAGSIEADRAIQAAMATAPEKSVQERIKDLAEEADRRDKEREQRERELLEIYKTGAVIFPANFN